MKKGNDTLFQIGEITKTMGITRKTLLVYEEMGLLTPAWKDPDSGYRYYSADNMTQIHSIRTLQSLGLTLKEVAEYYYDTENIDTYLQRLMDLRDSLDRNIRRLQVRAAKRGDLTVRHTALPHQTCFCRRYRCHDVGEAAARLRDTYIAATQTGKMITTERMFTMRVGTTEEPELVCCIPVDNSYEGPERTDFAETPALCIYFRGPYEELPLAIRALMAYIKENNVVVTGPFRSIYLEGPPNRGQNSDDYITQVAVPIQR